MSAGDDETLTASRSALAAPARDAGPYRLIEMLGAGGMGTVWRARDEVLRRDVAVKRLPPARAGDVDARARMLREARAQAALSHPNVCTIHQAGEDDDGVWIAMELLAGPSLDVELTRAPLAPALVAAWGAEIARALAAAHARGLVHRDLKPSNVMLDADGRVKVTDFGLVKLVAGDARGDAATSPALGTTLTREGAIMGSPRYMSPEQARGDDVSPSSDVFSLGILLYELVSGARAFAGTSAMETIAAIIKDTPRPLRDVARRVPPAFAALVHRCLERDPRKRPSASEVAEALARPMPAPRNRRRLAVAAIGAVAAIAGAIVFASARGGDPDQLALAPTPAPVAPTAAKPPAPAPEITVLADHARSLAAFDPSGHDLFFVDEAQRLWRSVDGAAPTAVSNVGKVDLVTCCWEGRIVVWADPTLLSVSPSTFEVSPIRLGEPLGGWDAAFSEDGRRYAATREHTITIGETRGSSPRRTLDTGFPVFEPHWSPDGKWLAFLQQGPESSELMLVDADRSTLQATRVGSVAQPGSADMFGGLVWVASDQLLVYDTRGAEREPVWSRYAISDDGVVRPLGASSLGGRPLKPLASNGHGLAAIESRFENQICIADFDGNRMGPLEPQQGPPGDQVGAWLDDHRLLIAEPDAATRSQGLAIMAPGGTPSSVLPTDEGIVLSSPSAAGDAIYFLRASAHEPAALWATDGFVEARKVVAVPDAFSLSCGTGVCAVVTSRGEHHEVRLVNLSTGSLGPVFHQAGDWYGDAAVSPDGRYVAVGANDSIWVYDRQAHTSSVRKPSGLTYVQSIAFWGHDLIVTDEHFAPGAPALLRVKPNNDVETLAGDAQAYFRLAVDQGVHRIAVGRTHIHTALLLMDVPATAR